MNSYIVKIMQLLLSNNKQIELSFMIKELGITKRMFLYYQKQLNEYLADAQLPLVQLENDQLSITITETKDIMEDLLNAVPLKNYILNAEERQDCILIEIGVSTHPIKLEYLIDTFQVSRNTIIHDLASIKKDVAEYHILLTSKQKSGYFLDGDEWMIRYLLLKAYHQRNHAYIDAYKKKILFTQLKYYGVNEENLIQKVQSILVESEHLVNENFLFLVLPDLSQTILLMYMRSIKVDVSLEIDELLEKNKQMLDFIIMKFKDLNIEWKKNEISYLYVILQAAKISSMDELAYEEKVISLAQAIILEFEAVSQWNLSYQKNLFDMFLLHIKSMYYRTKYKIKITNFQEIGMNELQGFYYITSNVMKNIGEKFQLFVDDDEIRFLSYYFSCLENPQALEKTQVDEHIVVVCVSGLGSSVYLKYQLTKLFENMIPIVISDIRNMEHIVNEHTKLIVTTIDINDKYVKGKNIKKVNTILTQANKRELLEWFLNDNIQNKENMIVHDVIDIIKSYTIIQNQEKLFQQLNQYFYAETNIHKELQLQDLIIPKYIRIYDKAETWKQMIAMAGEPLLEEQIIKQSYLDDIVSVIDTYGLYCECVNGVLVAHAKPNQNVVRPVLSLAVFHQPFWIEKWQKEISAVFVLGVTDKEAHVNAFAQLITTLSQDELYKRLSQFTSVEELYINLIKSH